MSGITQNDLKEITAVFGKQRFLMFRLLKDAKEKAAAKLALQTEHKWSFERSTDSTATKDGNVTSSGGLETTMDISAVSTRDEVNSMLYQSVVEDLLLEVWEIDLGAPGSEGKYKAKYARGRLNKWELPNGVEGTVEFSTTMVIDGTPVDGEATVPADQLLLVKAAYKFQDTVKVESE